MCLCVSTQQQKLSCQYEKKQKELKNLYAEEVQLKRAQGMKLDKVSKLNIRMQKKRQEKEQHIQDVMGYFMSFYTQQASLVLISTKTCFGLICCLNGQSLS